MTLNLAFPERQEAYAITVRNGVLVHERGVVIPDADVSATMPRAAFLGAMFAGLPAASAKIDGDSAAFAAFGGFFDAPDPGFAIVTP
jgi:alkyl sulfatase BDS1-like metallo-beta-lactamase superfamily hydrolase